MARTISRLRHYKSWNVSYNGNIVVFGCGAVRMHQSLIRRLADTLEANPNIKTLAKEKLRLMRRSRVVGGKILRSHRFNPEYINELKTISKRIGTIDTRISKVRGMEAIRTVVGKVRGRQSFEDVISASPRTLRRMTV